MMVNGGFEARTDVAHPSVASTASRTASYRVDQMGENVVMVEGVAMAGVQRRCRASHQDRVRDDRLQARRRLHHPPQRCAHLGHVAYRI